MGKFSTKNIILLTTAAFAVSFSCTDSGDSCTQACKSIVLCENPDLDRSEQRDLVSECAEECEDEGWSESYNKCVSSANGDCDEIDECENTSSNSVSCDSVCNKMGNIDYCQYITESECLEQCNDLEEIIYYEIGSSLCVSHFETLLDCLDKYMICVDDEMWNNLDWDSVPGNCGTVVDDIEDDCGGI
jgi:hypothetical protein